MIGLIYALWIGPAHWPISVRLTWLILAELSAEDVILFAVASRGMVRAWRQGRR